MFVFLNEKFINGITVINNKSKYQSHNGAIYCEGCMLEEYYDTTYNKMWKRRSSKLLSKPNRIYRYENNRYKLVGQAEALLISDWEHRFIKCKFQNF